MTPVGSKIFSVMNHSPKYLNSLFLLSPMDTGKLLSQLERLMENDKEGGVAWTVAWSVAENFDKLPPDVRNNLLLKLSEKDKAALDVASTVRKNFDMLPEEVRNQLLLKLKDDRGVSLDIASSIAKNYDKLPDEIRGILLQLAQKEESAPSVAWAGKYNFDKLPEEVRNRLLLTLSDKVKTALAVSSVIACNFGDLPFDVKDILFKLAERNETAHATEGADSSFWAVAENYDNLPQDVQSLLFKLKDKASWDVGKAVEKHANKIPEDVRRKLLEK